VRLIVKKIETEHPQTEVSSRLSAVEEQPKFGKVESKQVKVKPIDIDLKIGSVSAKAAHYAQLDKAAKSNSYKPATGESVALWEQQKGKKFPPVMPSPTTPKTHVWNSNLRRCSYDPVEPPSIVLERKKSFQADQEVCFNTDIRSKIRVFRACEAKEIKSSAELNRRIAEAVPDNKVTDIRNEYVYRNSDEQSSSVDASVAGLQKPVENILNCDSILSETNNGQSCELANDFSLNEICDELDNGKWFDELISLVNINNESHVVSNGAIVVGKLDAVGLADQSTPPVIVKNSGDFCEQDEMNLHKDSTKSTVEPIIDMSPYTTEV